MAFSVSQCGLMVKAWSGNTPSGEDPLSILLNFTAIIIITISVIFTIIVIIVVTSHTPLLWQTLSVTTNLLTNTDKLLEIKGVGIEGRMKLTDISVIL